ncbi:HNH endonuclease [Peribacillus sp. NPDC097198]|uniref:HNH endonuclease n=1 Tax=Peribacillus sp. NPDC097198 TaxID=3364397 RepID=UPI003803230F
MLSGPVHQGILRKFEGLKGQTIVGKVPIKGINKEQRVPADQFVEEDHILHDLIRGFYKPAGMPFLISYQATESDENYGHQIIWKDKTLHEFDTIEMRPPSSPKDNRKKSDIAAARYNLENQIPIGILHKVEKGVNLILGLGMIVEENEKGAFIVKPYSFNTVTSTSTVEKIVKQGLDNIDFDEELITEIIKEVKQRKGQAKFRKLLLMKYKTCVLCSVEANHTRASHIKPWAFSTNQERLDIHNGILLCPNHDHLFDKGLITFEKTGNILTSSLLSSSQQMSFNINSRLLLQMADEMQQYMAYHRQYVFKK